MQNYEQILKEFGIEVPEDKKSAISTKMNENYKAKEDWQNAVNKRDEYKKSLDDTLKKIQSFEKEDVDGLKTQIRTLTTTLETERQERQKEASKRALESTIDGFLNERNESGELVREFVNSITSGSIRNKLFEELEKDTAKGKSVSEIFTSMITGEDGKQLPNILIDKEQQQLEDNKARFTGKLKAKSKAGMITADDFKGMSLDERIKLKQENPELYGMLRKGD